MGSKSAIFEAEGGEGESRWSYRAVITRSEEKVSSMEMDASYGGHELQLWMDAAEISIVCEKVRQWMNRCPGFPTDARLIIDRFLTEQLPAQLKPVATLNNCAVCLMPLENGIKKLRCSHEFHRDCVDQWLTLRNSCPLCRHSISATPIDEVAVANMLSSLIREANNLSNHQLPEIDHNVGNRRRQGNVGSRWGVSLSTPIVLVGVSVLLTGIFVLLKPAPVPAPEPFFSFTFEAEMDFGK